MNSETLHSRLAGEAVGASRGCRVSRLALSGLKFIHTGIPSLRIVSCRILSLRIQSEDKGYMPKPMGL